MYPVPVPVGLDRSPAVADQRVAMRVVYATMLALEPVWWPKGLFRSGEIGRGKDSFLEACAPVVQAAALASAARPTSCSGQPCDYKYIVLTNDEGVMNGVMNDLRRSGVAASMVPPELLSAVDRFREVQQRTNKVPFWAVQTLYKLALIKMTDFDWACFLDLDVLPYSLPHHWMLQDPAARAGGVEFMGCSSPGNTMGAEPINEIGRAHV